MNHKTYFTSGRVRKLPFLEAWLNPNWRRIGFACVLVVRQHVNGNFSYGGFLIDVFCLGIKDALFFANQTKAEYDELLERYFSNLGGNPERIGYNEAHNLVFGALAYAEDLGFAPHPDFDLAKWILEDDTDDIPLIEYEFGRDGMPVYFPGPRDNYGQVLVKLRQHAGEGNFDVVLPDGDTYLNLKKAGIEVTHQTIVEALRIDTNIRNGNYGDDEEDEDYYDEDEEDNGWINPEEVKDPNPHESKNQS
ncbi:MAG: hypothetical protein MUC97_08455 [Bernardetiaceae bacterium]|nr:hypothetical protein [Bernardetiaceae bacterium]